MTDVLICGAGIAGSTLAYWLARAGLNPTVVERSQGARSSGNPVDVRGPALSVAEEMGIMPALRQAATSPTTLSLLAPSGRRVARLPTPAARGRRGEVEIPRADLAAVLSQAADPHAEFLFDDTITALHPDDHGVDVVFERAAGRRFDLVVGADGLHSTVRRLAFGPESDFVRHLGLYVATLPLGRPADRPDELVLYNTPGRLASLHPARGSAIAAFIFRGPAHADLDFRDNARQRDIVLDAYADAGWEVPQLLDALREAEEFYFDAVSTVRLSTWARGRVCLLGDAASCVSLLGDGSSLAIAGAHTLAKSLTSHPGIADALRVYEHEHRKLVAPKQRNIGIAAGMLVPKTRLGITARNLAAKALPGLGRG